MTKEQYERAVVISQRLRELEEFKKIIEKKSKHRLSFCYRDSNGDYSEVYYGRQVCIARYLDKYDNQIRKDIDDEIESLHKEIEEL